ncbi:MAG: hypothetical protein SNJ82_00170 [Gemmataceae bacterium]
MIEGNCWWLAAVIAAHPQRRILGRTRLQKTIKLLQRVGLPTDYRFAVFFYGPYSESIVSDVRLLECLGLVREWPLCIADGSAPSYLIEASETAQRGEVERFQPQIRRLQQTDLVVLELAATLDAYREMGSEPAEALERMRHKKASKWTEEREHRALELLADLGLIS